jgi:hypothetical protein
MASARRMDELYTSNDQNLKIMGKQNHSEPKKHLFYLNILGKLMTICDASKDKDFQKCR